MSSRNFGLAGLLRLRNLEQDQAARTLSSANARSTAIRSRQGAARRDLDESPAEVSSTIALNMAAIARASGRSMLAELQNLEAVQADDTAAAQAAFRTARARTVGLEKLEDKHALRLAAADLAAEQVTLDEIASGARRPAKEGLLP
jgi:flagellar FliJ protein